MDDNKKDKFKAVWVSYSSISDFLKCPRSYYLRNVYKDKLTGRKFTIITPPLALGQVVHKVIEDLSFLPVEKRLSESLLKKFEKAWESVKGEKGGFLTKEQERKYKKRGLEMLSLIEKNPGPILKKAIKIKSNDGLSYFWLSEEENIILCGKIDWIEYLPESDSVHIIDFKTGKKEEEDDSLQLPIYLLLVKNIQTRNVSKLSYWYLEKSEFLLEMKLPDENEAYEKILGVAKRIALARKLNLFKCKTGGCKYCYPYERILRGEGKKVGISEFKQDVFILD